MIKNRSIQNYLPILKICSFILVFSYVFYLRCEALYKFHVNNYESKDFKEYRIAYNLLIKGENPYSWTVKTFTYNEGEKAKSDHGFAYFPLFLYLMIPLDFISNLFNTSIYVLLKAVIMIAEILCGVLLVHYVYKKSYWAAIFGSLIYFFNPYNVTVETNNQVDSLPILFMFLCILFINTKNYLPGVFFAVSIGFKSFAYILFPLMLLIAKDRKKFLLSGIVTGLVISLPFLRNYEYFVDYVNGSFFVHSQRPIQGRPIPHFLGILTNFEFLLVIPNKIYTYLASFSGLIICLVLLFKYKIKDRFILSSIIFIFFYIFTPVFNRTYLALFIPILIIAVYNLSEILKKKYIFYILLSVFYLLYYGYLSIWTHGFHQGFAI